ncbi:hypothetical protein ACWGPT_17725 [Pseudorhizobium sp. NPDC055634]
MTECHFIAANMLETYALYQIPHGRTFVVECRACGMMKEIDRASLDRVSSLMSLKELSPASAAPCAERRTRGLWLEMEWGKGLMPDWLAFTIMALGVFFAVAAAAGNLARLIGWI